LVALHGCTQTARDFAAGTRFDSVAERVGAYVLYPEQSLSANPQRCWNWFLESNQRRDSGEPAAIIELTQSVISRYPIDPRRVYLAGLSAGGAMAAILAEQAPDVFSAVGIMAGVPLHASHDLSSAAAAMHGDVTDAHIVPIVSRGSLRSSAYDRLRATIWTGAADRSVDPENASVLARQFLKLLRVGESGGKVEHRADADIVRWKDWRGRVRVEAWRIPSMGHAWSGGSFRGSHTYPAGPRASNEMMAFFLSDGLAAPRSVNTGT